MTKTVGVILAGGASRRFGLPKAFARLGNQTLYERAADALIGHCDEIIVVTREELIGRFPNSVPTITDLPEYTRLGPLAGILSAMEYVKAQRYIILPCDMPYVTNGVIQGLLAVYQKPVTAVEAAGRYHPLVSIWETSTRNSIQDHLTRGQLSVMQFIVHVHWVLGSSLTENEELTF